MANYATLKAAIADVVKTNGSQAITGANLQQVLLSIVNSIGSDYLFAGVATPSTSVGTPDQNVFYITGAGTYANMGTSTTIPQGAIGVFKYNGLWSSSYIDIATSILPLTGYYTCGTGGQTAAKVVSAPNYTLTNGGSIKVKFTYSNLNDSPTLNVNGTGAKQIVYNGVAASTTNKWAAGDVILFYYNSTDDKWYGTTMMVDSTPTENSNHLVKSGSVYTGLNDKLSLSAQTLTTAQKEQARKNLGFGDGTIDSFPVENSHNLVESGGVYSHVRERSMFLNRGFFIDYGHAVNISEGVHSYIVSPNNVCVWVDLNAAIVIRLSLIGGTITKYRFYSDYDITTSSFVSENTTGDIPHGAIVCLINMRNIDNPSGYDDVHVDLITSDYPAIENKSMPIDLAINDENGNSLVVFQEGGLRTKEFDTKTTPCISNTAVNIDLAINDESGNSIVVLQDGGIRTKNFDTEKLFSNKYRGKVVSIFGDSISTYGTPDSRNEDGIYCWSYYPTETCRYSENGNVTIDGVTYQSIKFKVEDTWWMRVISSMRAQLGINDSWRGCKVSGTAESSFCNQTRIDHLGNNGNPDLIIVYAGTNDAGNLVEIGTFDTSAPPTTQEGVEALGSSTFAEAYRTMLIRLMFTYPNAEIVSILPTFTSSYYTITDLDKYVEVIKEACDFFGVKYIDARTSGINYYNKNTYLVDGIHPNSLGMEKLSQLVLKQILFN